MDLDLVSQRLERRFGFDVGLPVGSDRIHGHFDVVERVERLVDHRRHGVESARPDRVEHVLDCVGQIRGVLEADDATVAFEYVSRAEDVVDELLVVGILLDLDEAVVQRLDVGPGFPDKLVVYPGHVSDTPLCSDDGERSHAAASSSTLSMAVRMSASSNGLVT